MDYHQKLFEHLSAATPVYMYKCEPEVFKGLTRTIAKGCTRAIVKGHGLKGTTHDAFRQLTSHQVEDSPWPVLVASEGTSAAAQGSGAPPPFLLGSSAC